MLTNNQTLVSRLQALGPRPSFLVSCNAVLYLYDAPFAANSTIFIILSDFGDIT